VLIYSNATKISDARPISMGGMVDVVIEDDADELDTESQFRVSWIRVYSENITTQGTTLRSPFIASADMMLKGFLREIADGVVSKKRAPTLPSYATINCPIQPDIFPHLLSWNTGKFSKLRSTTPKTAASTKVLSYGWVRELYQASEQGVVDNDIIKMFDLIEEEVYKDREALNASLLTIDIDMLAPDFVVGIPRALYPLRGHLANWRGFVVKAKQSLSRKGLGAERLLHGLLD